MLQRHLIKFNPIPNWNCNSIFYKEKEVSLCLRNEIKVSTGNLRQALHLMVVLELFISNVTNSTQNSLNRKHISTSILEVPGNLSRLAIPGSKLGHERLFSLHWNSNIPRCRQTKTQLTKIQSAYNLPEIFQVYLRPDPLILTIFSSVHSRWLRI